MKLTGEQAQQLQEKLAKNPAEAAQMAKEFGVDLSTEDMEQVLGKVSGGVQAVSDDALENISGGIEINNVPNYDVIKDYYKEKGANLAFILCIYFIPSPSCYDIIKIIEEEVEDEIRRGVYTPPSSVDTTLDPNIVNALN